MTDLQNIHRRPDGSIDFDHYDRIARGLRTHDQSAALSRLALTIVRPLRIFGAQPSARIRALVGSQERRTRQRET